MPVWAVRRAARLFEKCCYLKAVCMFDRKTDYKFTGFIDNITLNNCIG